MNYIDLFNNILHCEDELEVVKLLIKAGIWDDANCWKYYGNNENNLSIISNQQSEAEIALNEKIVNSIDAVLLRECKREGIDPESSSAPSSLNQAISLYKENISKEDIQIYATGYKDQYPNIIIADYGEGQSPKYFEDTLLSLNKSNKLKIPFV